MFAFSITDWIKGTAPCGTKLICSCLNMGALIVLNSQLGDACLCVATLARKYYVGKLYRFEITLDAEIS